MTQNYTSPPKIQPPPLRRPFPITDPRLNTEIQACILYYNNTNDKVKVQWVSFSDGFSLVKILSTSNEKKKVKRCTLNDIREILNQGGRWLKYLRGCENRTFGPVSWEIVRYAQTLRPLDLPEIPHYVEEKDLRDENGRNTNHRG